MAYKQKGWSPFTLKTEKNTPILKKKLGKGIKAEANNDGTIFIDKSVKKGTREYKKVVRIGSSAHPIPSSINLENNALPNLNSIIKIIKSEGLI